MEIVADNNITTILATIYSVMKEHIWYAILPNEYSYVDDIGVGSNHRHENAIVVLYHLGYLIDKKNKLIFLKTSGVISIWYLPSQVVFM